MIQLKTNNWNCAYAGIYLIRNKENGKEYVGQSVNIQRRMNEHLAGFEQMIDRSIGKRGSDSFEFFVIEKLEDLSALDQRELYWINKRNSLVPNGYNISLIKGASQGEMNPMAKLTDKDVIFIRNCYKNKTYNNAAMIRREFFPNISLEAIQAVFYWRSWNHILPEYNTEELAEYYKKNHNNSPLSRGEHVGGSVLTERDVIQIRSMYTVKQQQIIAEELGFSLRLVRSIVYGQNWKHIPIYRKRQKRWDFPEEWSDNMKKDFLEKEVVRYVSE